MKKFLYAALSLLMFASCSDDPLKGSNDQGGANSEDNVPGVYIGVNFQMPGIGSSRSTTDDPDKNDDQSISNDGLEEGSDIENNVNEVLLILAREDFGFIAAATVQSSDIYKHTGNQNNGPSYHANAKFNKSQIEDYYNDPDSYDKETNTFKSKIDVFIVVNPNGGLKSYFEKLEKGGKEAYGDTGWINEAWQVKSSTGEGAIWSSANGGNFLMTNSKIAKRLIPNDIDAWELFSQKDNPFNLSEKNSSTDGNAIRVEIDNSYDETSKTGGPVNVQRACARFDYKDGSKTHNSVYPAVYMQNVDGKPDKTKPLISVELQRMSLVNMCNKFYYFERVSPDGLSKDAEICSPERPWYLLSEESHDNKTPLYKPAGGNYVVDYYAQDKLDAIEDNFASFKFSDYFEYSLFDDNKTINSSDLSSQSRWGSTDIKELLANNHYDNYKDNDRYNVWRYVTENVIPEATYDDVEFWQPNGLSTGIVFRAKMIGHEEWFEGKDDAALTSDEKILKHVVEAINGTGLTGHGWTDPLIYMYAGKLYATWQDLVQSAVEASLTFKVENGNIEPDWNRNNSLYMAVFGKNGLTGCTIIGSNIPNSDNKYEYKVYLPLKDEPAPKPNPDEFEYVDDKATKELSIKDDSPNAMWKKWSEAGKPSNTEKVTKDFKETVTHADITIYQSSDENGEVGYYCYYYYWNRHNDNNRDGVMGPMEYCTVRNNVYKLCVTDISRLGHPRLDENDPDTPTPNTPDEKSNVYITVDSKVIPWVVRINNIEF